MIYVVKTILLIAGILVLSGAVGFFVINTSRFPTATSSKTTPSTTTSDALRVRVLLEGLNTPWALVFLPNSDMLITERSGSVRLVSGGQLQDEVVATLPLVKEVGEGGLLGVALDPLFSSNHFVYLYYTYAGSNNSTLNRVVRMTYENNKLIDEKTLIDNIPGSSNHNGGRIKFGPDNYLYITTGDAENPSQAQDKNSLAGKILRVDTNGNPAANNPFNNRVYSYGHRNPQGLTWINIGKNPQLIATEHGRSFPVSGLDEINIIEAGKNYGWPTIQGDEKKDGMVTPILNSGAGTWAPADITSTDTSLYFVGLKGQALYKVDLNSKVINEYFKNGYGRIREIVTGPDGLLYITTSNKDGRGVPLSGDDKIIVVNPSKL